MIPTMYSQFRDIDVFILCGGQGKRIKRIFPSIPKPMIKIGETHFLDIMINYMSGFGFKRFILGLGYKADFIEKHYIENCQKGIQIVFSRESYPLDTGGALKNARNKIKSANFFVMNGDSFCKFSPQKLLKFHIAKSAIISILLNRLSDRKNYYGNIKLASDSRILDFKEKSIDFKGSLVNSGVYIFNKKAFEFMPQENVFSLEYDLFPKIAGKKFFGYKTSGFFIDIGTPVGYITAVKYFLDR